MSVNVKKKFVERRPLTEWETTMFYKMVAGKKSHGLGAKKVYRCTVNSRNVSNEQQTFDLKK